MRFHIHLFELLSANMGVNLGGGNTGVTEHFLYMPKICAVIQHGRRCDVAEQVAGTKMLYSGKPDITRRQLGKLAWFVGFAIVGQKQSILRTNKANCRRYTKLPALLVNTDHFYWK